MRFVGPVLLPLVMLVGCASDDGGGGEDSVEDQHADLCVRLFTEGPRALRSGDGDLWLDATGDSFDASVVGRLVTFGENLRKRDAGDNSLVFWEFSAAATFQMGRLRETCSPHVSETQMQRTWDRTHAEAQKLAELEEE